MVGGVPMSKPDAKTFMSYDTASQKDAYDPATTYSSRDGDVVYALTQYNHVSTDESGAAFKRLTAESSWGLPAVPGIPPLGTRTYISFGSLDPAYDRFRVYRKRNSDGGQWYLIYEADGTAANTTILDGRVDALNDPVPWGEVGIFPATKDFANKNAAFDGNQLSAWKGHLVVSSNQEVYLSYFDNPGKYVLPYRLSPQGVATTDNPAIGATGWLSDDTSDQVMGLASQDALYGAGKQGVYVSIGDSAVSSTPFRRMPGTWGAVSDQSSCAFEGGILVGAASGLYRYRAYRAISFGNDTNYDHDETSKEVRRHWQRLRTLGGSWPLIVRTWRSELWCIQGAYYLRRTRNGNWEFGKFTPLALKNGALGGAIAPYGTPSALPTKQTKKRGSEGDLMSLMGADLSPTPADAAIVDLIGDDDLGLFALTASGIIIRIADSIRWHAGYAFPWVAMFGAITMDQRGKMQAAQVRIRAGRAVSATFPVRIGFEVYDGRDLTRITTVDLTSEYSRVADAQTNPGNEIVVAVGSNSAAHQVVTIELDPGTVTPGSGH